MIKKRLVRTASVSLLLNSFSLNSGDLIAFESRILNNKPWFRIIQESQYNCNSFYDGNDFECAFELYIELLLAFKGLSKAEEIKKMKNIFLDKIKKLEKEKKQLTD